MSKNDQLDDYTTFDDQNWNGWEKGPAAAHPQDLVLRDEVIDGKKNYFLYNRTNTNQSAGIILKKKYSDLVVDATYDFEVHVRRQDPPVGQGKVPRIGLASNLGNIAPPWPVYTTGFSKVMGRFVARATDMELYVISDEDSGQGNDYDVDDIRVKRITSTKLIIKSGKTRKVLEAKADGLYPIKGDVLVPYWLPKKQLVILRTIEFFEDGRAEIEYETEDYE